MLFGGGTLAGVGWDDVDVWVRWDLFGVWGGMRYEMF